MALWRGLIAVAMALALAACASAVARLTPPDAKLAHEAIIPGMPGVRSWGDDVPTDLATETRRRLPGLTHLAVSGRRHQGRPVVDILALSGGGGDGAFGAGLLAGWAQRGDRPEFQIVTGVSAGAIIAPFAFLGPAYDRQLHDIWTEYETSELLTSQILPGLLGGPALADTSQLAALIERYVDRALMRAIATEYARGRILLVATTNIDAQRPVVWNMGEIARLATRGNVDAIVLFRKVIMGSAAIPGAFPPVHVSVAAGGKTYDEMHVDGGTTHEVFVTPVQAPFAAFDHLYRPGPRPYRRVFIVKNGKLDAELRPVPGKALSIAARAIETLVKYQHKSDIYRAWRMTRDDGAEFHLAAVPASFKARPKEAFDVAYQRALYEEGLRIGMSSGSFMREPPGERHPGTARAR